MSKITPEAFSVLSRIKRYGLDTWLPGKLVIERLEDTTFSSANAAIITELLANGYLSLQASGMISTALAGDHALSTRPSALAETRAVIRGRRFQVVTDDWAIEADAARVRRLVLSGLSSLADSAPERFERVYRETVAGREDEALQVIIVSALGLVTAKYSDAFSNYAHRVGVRIFGVDAADEPNRSGDGSE